MTVDLVAYDFFAEEVQHDPFNELKYDGADPTLGVESETYGMMSNLSSKRVFDSSASSLFVMCSSNIALEHFVKVSAGFDMI